MDMQQPGRRRHRWDADSIRALRFHLDVSQSIFAGYLGVRQQTVSEWETGVYRPRGASGTLLSLIAEQAGFRYSPPQALPRQAPGIGEHNPGPREPIHPAATPFRSQHGPFRPSRVIDQRDPGSRGYVPYVPPALRPSPRPPSNDGRPPRNDIVF